MSEKSTTPEHFLSEFYSKVELQNLSFLQLSMAPISEGAGHMRKIPKLGLYLVF
jgi:hypothetical protein